MWIKQPLSRCSSTIDLEINIQEQPLYSVESDTQENLTTEIQMTSTPETMIQFSIGSICESMWVCDLEETLDATRWFLGHDRLCIPTIPLNPHLFYLLNDMKPTALCIHPIWPEMGVHQIERSTLTWILEHTQIPICIPDGVLPNSDRSWLQTQGFELWETSA